MSLEIHASQRHDEGWYVPWAGSLSALVPTPDKPHISSMRRSDMTYRVVPLGSPEAAAAPVGATVAERLSMLDELSRTTWLATGIPLPCYSRQEMPMKLSTLREQGARDDR